MYSSPFDVLLGDAFSPIYGSAFWFVPLLAHMQLIFLSLNGLYLFSPIYSSFRMVCTYSRPYTAHLEKPGTTNVHSHMYYTSTKNKFCHSLTLGRLCDMYIDNKGQNKSQHNQNFLYTFQTYSIV